jgi:hypothetical protein
MTWTVGPTGLTLTGVAVMHNQDDRPIVAVITEVMRAILETAEVRDYNRQLPWSEELDEDAVHILSPQPTTQYLADPSKPAGYHDTAHQQPAPPHIRCRAWVKVKGERAAREGELDVALEFWPRDHRVLDGRRRWTFLVDPLARDDATPRSVATATLDRVNSFR